MIIDGEPTKGTSGTFYLEYRQDGKRIQKPCGVAPREALDAWRKQVAIQSGAVDPSEEELDLPTNRTTLKYSIDQFLAGVKATKSEATFDSYSRDLDWFKRHIKRHYVSQVTREDILRLMGVGRDAELNQKTSNKRLIVGLMAMRNAGAVLMLKKGDWPKTIDKSVAIYEPEEISKFFAACDKRELLIFQTFLCTGFRSRELATPEWPDMNWKKNSLSLSPKPQYRFKPKSYEERTMPVPSALTQSLRVHQMANKESLLMFPSAEHPKRPSYGGKAPDAHHLELCKEIALRAGLNCGRCEGPKGKCKTGPYCEHWYLHKWRHTFATNLLQSGVDIRSLQIVLGHKNIATTEKYLKSLRLDDLHDKIESSSLAAMIQSA